MKDINYASKQYDSNTELEESDHPFLTQFPNYPTSYQNEEVDEIEDWESEEESDLDGEDENVVEGGGEVEEEVNGQENVIVQEEVGPSEHSWSVLEFPTLDSVSSLATRSNIASEVPEESTGSFSLVGEESLESSSWLDVVSNVSSEIGVGGDEEERNKSFREALLSGPKAPLSSKALPSSVSTLSQLRQIEERKRWREALKRKEERRERRKEQDRKDFEGMDVVGGDGGGGGDSGGVKHVHQMLRDEKRIRDAGFNKRNYKTSRQVWRREVDRKTAELANKGGEPFDLVQTLDPKTGEYEIQKKAASRTLNGYPLWAYQHGRHVYNVETITAEPIRPTYWGNNTKRERKKKRKEDAEQKKKMNKERANTERHVRKMKSQKTKISRVEKNRRKQEKLEEQRRRVYGNVGKYYNPNNVRRSLPRPGKVKTGDTTKSVWDNGFSSTTVVPRWPHYRITTKRTPASRTPTKVPGIKPIIPLPSKKKIVPRAPPLPTPVPVIEEKKKRSPPPPFETTPRTRAPFCPLPNRSRNGMVTSNLNAVSRKECGHFCYMLEGMDICCECFDPRTRGFQSYLDGFGMVHSNRYWGYCPECQTRIKHFQKMRMEGRSVENHKETESDVVNKTLNDRKRAAQLFSLLPNVMEEEDEEEVEEEEEYFDDMEGEEWDKWDDMWDVLNEGNDDDSSTSSDESEEESDSEEEEEDEYERVQRKKREALEWFHSGQDPRKMAMMFNSFTNQEEEDDDEEESHVERVLTSEMMNELYSDTDSDDSSDSEDEEEED